MENDRIQMENYKIEIVHHTIQMNIYTIRTNRKLLNTNESIQYKRIFIQYKWKRPNIATFDMPYNLHIALISSIKDFIVSSFKSCAFK